MVKAVKKEHGDIAAPKPPKGKKDKKAPGPKLAAENLTTAFVGHNSGAIPRVVELMDRDLEIDAQKKELGKEQRDIRNMAKTEFGILSWNWNQEKAARKVDKDVRIQRESGAVDLKNMLGYQAELDLKPNTVARTEQEFADPSNKVRPEDAGRDQAVIKREG